MSLRYNVSGFFLSFILFISCNSPSEEEIAVKEPEIERVMTPFRYHKAIEVKPGLTMDIVSWGRGSDSVGGYLILRSDSTQLRYRSTSGELNGRIVDACNMDLDSDGNPELYIHARGVSEDSYLTMYIHEFSENGSNQKISFPELSSSLKRGYKGRDSIYVEEGKLIREFPVFNGADSTESNTSKEIRKLEYSLRNNTLQVRQIDQNPDR
jgi:hypothetical protein